MRTSSSFDFSPLIAPKTYKLSEVKDKLIRVAFDIVRFKEGPAEELWQVQEADDGNSYIIARYDTAKEEDGTVKTASSSPWDVKVNDITGQINIFYKDYQVAKLAASTLGVDSSDLPSLQQYLPAKLSSDQTLVKSLLNTLSSTERYQFCRQFPEINKA